MSSAVAPASAVLADLLPGRWTRDIALVISGTVLLIIAGQFALPLWFTPVPLSLATFVVLLEGAALGPWRSVNSVAIYLLAGAAGAPIFADQQAGTHFASFGYIVGYVPAALLVGMMSRRRADRQFWASSAMAALGSLVIYIFGVAGLMSYLRVDIAEALKLGVYPFLLGDALKCCATATLLPGAWRLISRFMR